jgi:predicted aminopeptidase
MMSPARLARWALAVLVICVTSFLTLIPTGRYLRRAAWEEAKILLRRKPITQLVAASDTDPHARAKLRLVLAARAFAVDSVGLRARESFTTYSQLHTDTLVLVLAGAYRDKLEPYTWWFPIVGRMPYKGFFDVAAAREAARDLERRGFDTYVRPAAAFSTLGWFNDPLLSTTLREDSVGLANTVIHELTHNTFYAPGQAVFNESFANFVGAHGATWFFRVRGDSARVAESEADWAREKFLGHFWESVYNSLDSAFKAHPRSVAERLAARDTIFARARATFTTSIAPRLPGYRPRTPLRLRLDNASLLSRRVYRTGLDLLDGVYAREGNDLRRAIARVIALAGSRPKDPYAALREWLASPPAETPAK